MKAFIAFASFVVLGSFSLAFAGPVSGFYTAKVTGVLEEQGPNETKIVTPLTKARLCQIFFVNDPRTVEVVVNTDGAYLLAKADGSLVAEVMAFDAAEGYSLDLTKIEKFVFATTFFGSSSSKGIAKGKSKFDKKGYLSISVSAMGFSNTGAPGSITPRAIAVPSDYLIKVKFTPDKRFVPAN